MAFILRHKPHIYTIIIILLYIGLNCDLSNENYLQKCGSGITVSAYNNTDTFNGQPGTPAMMTLASGESAQFFSDGVNNNWIIINGIPPV
jgi:hypothetical protein